ncbi:putative RNA-binding protein 39 [Paratrimastix pyriformis]|uniref:RNA-binding protein 39 n=1 Tax=Paratrimastix pyriformis TaxID=342808 RepID=A0ABQ8UD27_9EUKA|nr:putative RNA-binding protein 39 [Paratrimastix pyriformis]
MSSEKMEKGPKKGTPEWFACHQGYFWNRFYTRNTANFFKDRHWIVKEFPQYCLKPEPQVLMEVGCGTGATIYPLLKVNPLLRCHAFDLSRQAVGYLKCHDDYDPVRVNAFVWDLARGPFPVWANVPDESVDIATNIFILSALTMAQVPLVLRRLSQKIKPGGVVIVRDYAQNDLAQVRFDQSRKLDENLYVRWDGTQSQFFSLEGLTAHFADAGFERIAGDYVQRVITNRSSGQEMNRSWVNAVFRPVDLPEGDQALLAEARTATPAPGATPCLLQKLWGFQADADLVEQLRPTYQTLQRAQKLDQAERRRRRELAAAATRGEAAAPAGDGEDDDDEGDDGERAGEEDGSRAAAGDATATQTPMVDEDEKPIVPGEGATQSRRTHHGWSKPARPPCARRRERQMARQEEVRARRKGCLTNNCMISAKYLSERPLSTPNYELDEIEKLLDGGKPEAPAVATATAAPEKKDDQSKDPERDRDRDRERGRRDQEREHRSDRDRDSRRDRSDRDRRTQERAKSPSEMTEEEKKKREEEELERDLRTVFVSHISPKVDERKLRRFFEDHEVHVRDVRLIMDRNSRRSKGFGYVECADRESLDKIFTLIGQQLEGFSIQIQRSEAEKNKAAAIAQAAAAAAASATSIPMKLYVGSLNPNIREADLRQLFAPWGDIDSINIIKDESGHSKGFGFIQYKRAEDGRKAMAAMNGFEVVGMQLKVSLAESSAKSMVPMGGMAGPMMGGMSAAIQSGPDLDSEDVHLNPQSRALLMAKLQRGEAMPGAPMPMNPLGMPLAGTGAGMMGMMPMSPSCPAPHHATMVYARGAGMMGMMPVMGQPMMPGRPAMPMTMAGPLEMPPTRCLLLKNMFNPAESVCVAYVSYVSCVYQCVYRVRIHCVCLLPAESASNPGLYGEVREDVEMECAKYGPVERISVVEGSAGNVYVLFAALDGAARARGILNGRWFGGQQIIADFVNPDTFPGQ